MKNQKIQQIFFGSRVLRLEEKEGKSHAQRKGHSGKCWLNLLHACKPHNQAITSLAVDPEGKILASGVSITVGVGPLNKGHVGTRYFIH